MTVISSGLARPQDYSSSSSTCDYPIRCDRTETAPGVYSFECVPTAPCIISREDVLWLKGSQEAQELNVVVPNYRLEEVIKAAFKSQAGAGAQVNILLK